MKQLSIYINEKLHIDKSVKTADLSNIKCPNIFPENSDIRKMSDYHNKGSKPSRLVATIKDNEKLKRRFAVAVKMGWNEAIDEFGKALVDRNIYSQEEVDKFIEIHYK